MNIIRSGEGIQLQGGRQTIKLFGQDTAGQCGVMLSVIPAGAGVPTHVHRNEDELFVLVEGRLLVNFNGQGFLLGAGDLIFLPRGIAHGFTAEEDTKMWVYLTPGGAEKMFVELAELPAGPDSRQRMEEICASYGVAFV